ncbi:MAG: type IX secretion system membrane protein PorP/SprF [Flavobacteriales bacterium]|nr:type IX secretion system membrane protein PorP/SprF [Flavobacteriales bacterium]
MRMVSNFVFLLLGVFLLGKVEVYAQQPPQFSQFVFNNFLINPASGGTNDYIDFKLGYRTQWLGFGAQPVTFLFSAHSPISLGNKEPGRFGDKPHHAVGGYLLKDATGPISKFNGYLSYSYHMRLSYTVRASFGFFGGVKQYKLDPAGLTTPDKMESLPSFTAIAPDAAAGFWIYSKKYFGGVSAHQLIPLGLGGTANKLTMHYFLTGGYVIKIKKIESKLIPSAHVKFGLTTPIQTDIQVKFDYQNILWAALAYRKTDALIGIVGFNVYNTFQLGYAFDFTLSKLRKYSSNTHEIIISWRFKPRQRMQDTKCPDWG